jgi:hypothetical protein
VVAALTIKGAAARPQRAEGELATEAA